VKRERVDIHHRKDFIWPIANFKYWQAFICEYIYIHIHFVTCEDVFKFWVSKKGLIYVQNNGMYNGMYSGSSLDMYICIHVRDKGIYSRGI
jgi:hypothetical protein